MQLWKPGKVMTHGKLRVEKVIEYCQLFDKKRIMEVKESNLWRKF